MNEAHSPWPLFCNDLNQAQKWIIDKLAQTPTDRQLGHQALSLGLTGIIKKILTQDNLNLQDETARQWKFRLARLSGSVNPYAALIPPEVQIYTDLQINHAKREGIPTVVSQLGGIGDHLEAISMLLTWSENEKMPLILQVNPQLKEILTPLIASIPQFVLESKVYQQAIPSMAMRDWICRHEDRHTVGYNAWITNKLAGQKDTKSLLCCWKAKGEGNLLSAHLRSVPFPIVLEFYKRVKEQNSELCLTDISEWKPEELLILQGRGINCVKPKEIGLRGLMQACKKQQIITIDTALAHLCAVTGTNATVLLNCIPDERWFELDKPENCYGKYLRIVRQSQFCNWDDALSSLANYTSF